MKLQTAIQELTQVLKGHPEILFAILYGSAAEGRPFRDADLHWADHLAQEGGWHLACSLAQQVTEK